MCVQAGESAFAYYVNECALASCVRKSIFFNINDSEFVCFVTHVVNFFS